MAENTNANLVFSADSRLSSNNPSRRALGEVSPNVRQQPSSATMLNSKPLTGSPLKRSFTAAMEGGQGFQYLKRRKLSIDSPLSQVHTAAAPVITQPLPQWSPALPLQENPLPEIQHISPSEPTRPNTPNDSPEEEDGPGSNERRSFSSLINYDPSSQTAPSSQQPAQSATTVKGPSYAELLRLRLRVAMYKVRTNQTDIPFDDLRVEQSPPPPPHAFALVPSEQQPCAQLLPAPLLRPTAYSNRMLYNMPSSPPSAFSPAKLSRGGEAKTPTSGRFSAPEQELTSSIVKGRVAEGLLGLRNAV
ncbi:hypothetical protein CLAFUW4_00822 [Fulvia fulva]|uniref:Uncharacterized protein n=1 Tax=Passalora fulva TaxID=5499 RepID=A0A9Q8L596_PASFU|nr:uncharacterized protein CLAFUR5_00825 [Fulvia fulva]KAK4634078.1 hypothetical protein CLAFUR4_00823 [Fulvia fulva]KAK4636854.1 hypothetical protein CLAFUR0_00824 [Fulvia fulva]UJO11106.1 hypothetical protein CLAFUR5_00825 [Fulvia fulva]WPV09327.1 hypothetical protein CLAFUW4_00822 [Fulvia fulva]WPV24248.1 hypothetical protein CLAFUW7_00994 [Fulvia fulva]